MQFRESQPMDTIRGALIDGNGGVAVGVHTFGRQAQGWHAPANTEITKKLFSGYKWPVSAITCLRGNRSALLRIYLHLTALQLPNVEYSAADAYHVAHFSAT